MSPDMQWLGKRKFRDCCKQLAYAVLCGAEVYYLADCEVMRNFRILRNLETKCNEDEMLYSHIHIIYTASLELDTLSNCRNVRNI
jgi:hypothetical protein